MAEATQLEKAFCELTAEVVQAAGSASLRVTGLSMLPSIRPGDELVVRRHVIGDLTPGEVVLFRRDGKLTAHRIMRISGEYLITRGDSAPANDPPVRMSELVGRVEGILRDGRPVAPGNSIWRSVAAWTMRRSELCTRLFLRLTGGGRRFAGEWSTMAN